MAPTMMGVPSSGTRMPGGSWSVSADPGAVALTLARIWTAVATAWTPLGTGANGGIGGGGGDTGGDGGVGGDSGAGGMAQQRDACTPCAPHVLGQSTGTPSSALK
eukprot:2759706-Prymnesium_polylepis.1